MRCVVLSVILICLAVVQASRHHPRHVVLRGHPTIDTQTHAAYTEDSTSAIKQQFIVHLNGPVHHGDVKQLEIDLDVTFDMYLPHNSFLMYARPSVAKTARAHPLVLWVGVFRPEYKLASDVLSAIEALPQDADAHLDVTTVSLTESDRAKIIAELASTTGALVGPSGLKTLSVIVPRKAALAALEKLAAHPAVHTIDLRVENSLIKPHTFVSEVVEYGSSGVTPLSSSGLDGTGQIIGAGDSGLSTSSCYFVDPTNPVTLSAGRIYTSTVHRKIVLYDATNGDFLDSTGHGTNAVGAALGEYFLDTDTLNNYKGIASMAKVAFLDLQSAGNGSGGALSVPSNLATGYFSPLVTAGAKTVLSAWGSYNTRRLYTVQEQAVDEYLAANPTVVAVFSAGNDGSLGSGSINSPASSKNAIAVGASQNSVPGYEDALDTSAIISRYNNYYTRLCGSSTTFDPLWSDSAFCGGVGLNPAPCANASFTADKDNFCGLFQLGAEACCSYRNYAPFRTCCVEDYQNAISFAPASYSLDNLASFSSRGPTFDGRIKPDVVAPGESVKTAASSFICPLGTLTDTDRASAVTVASGTSVAAGVAAGAVALIRQYFVGGFYPQGYAGSGAGWEPPSALVKALLVAGAQPLMSVSGVFTGLGQGTWGNTAPYDNKQGFGRIQLGSSLLLNSTSFNSPFASFIANGSLATGGSWTKCISFASAATTPITIAIVWTDPAAATSAGVALVNNLDLSVSYQSIDKGTSLASDSPLLIQGATVVYPNGLGQPDFVNNVERITVQPTGSIFNIFIHVYGANVPKGPQNFWIVILGDFVEDQCGAPFLCPRSCSGAGTCDTQTGQCACTATGVSGPDCTAALTCGSLGNCSGNGVCNSAGACVCGNGFSGANCETSLYGAQSGSGSVATGVTKKTGISTGVFIGVVIALFFFGCILALFIGVFGGLKYAEWRRQKAKAKANRMLSNDSRSL